MNESFRMFVSSSKALIKDRGVAWDFHVEADGTVPRPDAWSLNSIGGAQPIPTYWLSNLGCDVETLASLNARRALVGLAQVPRTAFSPHWQDLIKAAVARQLLVERNTPGHVMNGVARPLRVLATCVTAGSGGEPWEITADDIRLARDVADEVQPSGKLADNIGGVARQLLDARHLCDHGPFSHLLGAPVTARGGTARGPVHLRKVLDERRSEEKLPGSAELWMLVDVVFTRQPLTYMDRIRFAALRLLILCGFRVGEACTIPADWERIERHVDLEGTPAGLLGGISCSMKLRHFAEKQHGADENSVLLSEAFQHVPPQFEDIVRRTLEQARLVTEPLRRRLAAQVATGRAFPEFAPDALIPLPELYTRLSGNPVIRHGEPSKALSDAYRESFDPSQMELIAQEQARSREFFSEAFYFYWRRWQKAGGPAFRTSDGNDWISTKRRTLSDPSIFSYADLFVRAGELEAHVKTTLKTKLSDTHLLPLEGGVGLPPDQLMFLLPKRALSEGRNEGLCDLGRYFSVGRLTSQDLIVQLNGRDDGLFARYGADERERSFSLGSHSLRHLQNGELFRLGISDAAITKRFGRKSVAQSHVYDHRSLAEELDAMSLPSEAAALPERAKIVAKMILAGRASGSVPDEFRRLMREKGPEEGFQFLAAEADGFHVTPYGFCINGFTQEPCPKHLQCADGCRQLVNSGNERHRANLETLEARTLRAVVEIEARKGGVGRDNQLAHARRVAANIRTILNTAEGERPFPDGPDLFKPALAQTALDG